MKVNIVLNECDVLSGAFQCAIVVEDRFHKSVIYRGMYELKDTVASKPEPGLECKESKGKSANADASVSLTATGKSRKKGKSAGYRTVPEFYKWRCHGVLTAIEAFLRSSHGV
uniref:Uncharacterized protein n=1 Tax=Magallana gigas TaxID=29159 RepID=K1PNU6_MAGGI